MNHKEFFNKKEINPRIRKKNYKIYLILIGSLILITGLIFVYVMINLIEVNSLCVKNPFVYAAETIIDGNGEPIENALCSCSVEDKNFYFDKEGMYKENPLLEKWVITP